MSISTVFLAGPDRPSFSRAGKPIKVGDFVSVVGVVTRVDVAGNNYGPHPTVTLKTDAGYTPEVPGRNVYSAQGTGTSTVISRDGKPINVGDAATITGTVAALLNGQVSLDADNNSQAVGDSDCYNTMNL